MDILYERSQNEKKFPTFLYVGLAENFRRYLVLGEGMCLASCVYYSSKISHHVPIYVDYIIYSLTIFTRKLMILALTQEFVSEIIVLTNSLRFEKEKKNLKI